MSRNLEIEECLIDKSANAFTSMPEFSELVALVHKFGEMLGLTPFTFFDLELALQHEAEFKQNISSGPIDELAMASGRSQLIENLFCEILNFFSTKFDKSNMCKKLYFMLLTINRWCVPSFNVHLLLPSKEEKERTEDVNENLQDDESLGDDNAQIPTNMDENSDRRSQTKPMESRGQSISATSQLSDEINARSQTTSSGRSESQYLNKSSKEAVANERRPHWTATLKPDYMNLSTEDKLKLLCFLIDAELACAEDTGDLDKTFAENQQRTHPLVIDSNGHKFWYFGDTWLFMEEGKLLDAEKEERIAKEWETKRAKVKEATANEPKQNGKKTKAEKKIANDFKGNKTQGRLVQQDLYTTMFNKSSSTRITQQQLDEIYAELFTGYQLRVVCKCSEHFEALIEAYKKQRNIKQDAETIEKLGQCMKTVQDIERERLRKVAEEAKKRYSPMRHSNRIAKILEQRKIQEEDKQRRHAAIMAERKMIEQEQEEFMREHRRKTDSEMKQPRMSREERLKQRQQRIQDQLDKEELIEAGLIAPSPSMTMTTDESNYADGQDETESMENEEVYQSGRPKSIRRQGVADLPPCRRMPKRRTKMRDLSIEKNDNERKRSARTGRNEDQQKRMGAMDWWPKDMAQNTSSDGSFVSLFQSKTVQTHRSNILKKRSNEANENGNSSAHSNKISPEHFELKNSQIISSAIGNNIKSNGLRNRYTAGGLDNIRSVLNLAASSPTPTNPSLTLHTQFNRSKQQPSYRNSADVSNQMTLRRWATVNPAQALGIASSAASIDTYKPSSFVESLAGTNNEDEQNVQRKMEEQHSTDNQNEQEKQQQQSVPGLESHNELSEIEQNNNTILSDDIDLEY